MSFQFKSLFQDSFRSLLTGLGVPGRDRVTSLSPALDTITYNMRDLENLYRGNWLAKKIVDIPAFDCTRAWRSWDGEEDQVEKLKKTERDFGLQRKMMDAMIKSRLYGGAAIVMGIKGSPFNEELDLEKVGKGDLKFIHVVEKWMIQAGPRVRDITSPWFGEPSYYMRSNVPIIAAPGGVTPLESSSLGYKPGDTIFIHPSRVVRLVGIEYPDVEHSPDAWGDSVLSSIYEAIRDASLVTQSLANMIADSKVDVFKIPGLTSTLSTQDGTDKMISYFANANVAKSVVNSLVIDKEIDWERIQTKFEGLPEVLQAYLLICAAGADIPSTRMLSREPSGQNATGESDTRNYYDRLSSEQEVVIRPILSRLDEVLIRSTFGDRPEEINYEWNPLWQMTAAEKADIAFKKAQAYQIDVAAALIPAEALVVGRQNQLIEDGVYPGLATALDELQENWNEEAEFLPIQQMGQQSELQEGQQSHEQGMQKEQLSSQEKMFQAKPKGDDEDEDDKKKAGGGPQKENDMFRGASRRLAFIRRAMYDEGGQASLGFSVSQATSVEGRKKRKRPFAKRGEDPDPDVNYGPSSSIQQYPRDAEYVEEVHPRGEHGRWTEGHGTEGESFVSPNVHHLDFHEAVQAIGGYHHEQFKRAANQVDAATNAYAVERSVIGAWSDGAEDSTMMVSPKISHDDLMLNAAMKGALGRQKQVLVFDDDEHGPDQLYHLQIPGATLLQAHEELLKDGIEFHTLLPREAGTEVIVVDTNGSMRDKLDILADRHGASGVVYNGKADFIGTTKEDGNEEDQRADAVRQYEALIAHSQSDKRGVWPQLRDRWAGSLRASERPRQLARTDSYEEEQHPRAEHGRWVSTGLKALGTAAAVKIKSEWVANSPIKSIHDIIVAAPLAQQALGLAGREIAHMTGAEFKDPGPKTKTEKGVARVAQKIANYNGVAARVTDAARGAFIVDTPQQSDNIVARLAAHFEVIAEDWRTTPVGYMDRAVLVRFHNGLIGEVQIIDHAMSHAKSDTGGNGHGLYVEHRLLDPVKDRSRVEALVGRMKDLYGSVQRNYPPVWKAVAGRAGG